MKLPPDQGEMCLSEAPQIHTVAEASQVFIQGLSIDFRSWMKAGIKDGMQFVFHFQHALSGTCSSFSSVIAGGC